MNLSSPLRYPGGKSAFADFLRETRSLNDIAHLTLAEPFAGGAGASLRLLFLEQTRSIFINDADPGIYAFWWSVLHRRQAFDKMLKSTRVSMAEWRRQVAVYRGGKRVSRLRRGFATFYLNRCNRSGIIVNGGPIGGVQQLGTWKIGARFNKPELRKRCERVAEYRDRIDLACYDGVEFIQALDPSETFFFIDPPYRDKGPTLYMDTMTAKKHTILAEQLASMRNEAWVLTYDDCPEIRRLYRGWATIRPYSLRYVAAERRSGKEVLIAPKWMRLPPIIQYLP